MTFIPQILFILWRIFVNYYAVYLPIKRLKDIHSWAVSDWKIFYSILWSLLGELLITLVLWRGGFY